MVLPYQYITHKIHFTYTNFLLLYFFLTYYQFVKKVKLFYRLKRESEFDLKLEK